MRSIAIGGWQHETNTFATIRADYQAFVAADEWPGLHEGQEMLDVVRPVHLPIAGAIRAIEDNGFEVRPLLWCAATPCSYVLESAFERICARMLCLIEQSLPVDAVYLDLHGAMVCEHVEDGEGEFLSRLRKLVGQDLPVFVSLDLHANVTPRMVRHATLIDVYRTYPHVDMGETGYRVAELLCRHLRRPRRMYHAFEQIGFLIPLNTGCTLIEPCRSLYQALPEMVTGQVAALSFACGFHLSDIHDAGPSVLAYGYDRNQVSVTARAFARLVTESRPDFREKVWSVAEGIAEARRLHEKHGRTIVIADTQDNPGGGGAGDTIGVLEEMIRQGLGNAAIGVINDSTVAGLAHEMGAGTCLDVEIGGRAGASGQKTLPVSARVLAVGDGRFTATGPMYRGSRMEIGRTALLQVAGIKVLVGSVAVQTADQAHFRHIGIEPSEQDFVVVKSSVHFRNDYQDIASRILIVAAPGEVCADPSALSYRNLRQGVDMIGPG